MACFMLVGVWHCASFLLYPPCLSRRHKQKPLSHVHDKPAEKYIHRLISPAAPERRQTTNVALLGPTQTTGKLYVKTLNRRQKSTNEETLEWVQKNTHKHQTLTFTVAVAAKASEASEARQRTYINCVKQENRKSDDPPAGLLALSL